MAPLPADIGVGEYGYTYMGVVVTKEKKSMEHPEFKIT
jgi:hypothetical protein